MAAITEIETFYPNEYPSQLNSWVGKWVRFYKNGTPVIGVVLYTKKTVLNSIELCTDVGICDAESVLESR